MEFEPPRARKKYSKTLESDLNRLKAALEERAPGVLKPSVLRNQGRALAAVVLSIIPGLGGYYLARKVRLPLVQLGGWLVLFGLYTMTRGSAWGWFLVVLLFSYHQYLLYRSYLDGLLREGSPLPGPLKGMMISALLALFLFFLYVAFSVIPLNSLSFRIHREFPYIY